MKTKKQERDAGVKACRCLMVLFVIMAVAPCLSLAWAQAEDYDVGGDGAYITTYTDPGQPADDPLPPVSSLPPGYGMSGNERIIQDMIGRVPAGTFATEGTKFNLDNLGPDSIIVRPMVEGAEVGQALGPTYNLNDSIPFDKEVKQQPSELGPGGAFMYNVVVTQEENVINQLPEAKGGGAWMLIGPPISIENFVPTGSPGFVTEDTKKLNKE